MARFKRHSETRHTRNGQVVRWFLLVVGSIKLKSLSLSSSREDRIDRFFPFLALKRGWKICRRSCRAVADRAARKKLPDVVPLDELVFQTARELCRVWRGLLVWRGPPCDIHPTSLFDYSEPTEPPAIYFTYQITTSPGSNDRQTSSNDIAFQRPRLTTSSISS
jgi:hypothetical protein